MLVANEKPPSRSLSYTWEACSSGRFPMLIVGDEGHYNGRFPWVTASLIVINVVAYVAQILLGPAFTLGWALVPGELPVLPDLIGSQRVSTADAAPTERRQPPTSPQR